MRIKTEYMIISQDINISLRLSYLSPRLYSAVFSVSGIQGGIRSFKEVEV